MNGMKEETGSGSRWRENAVHLWTPNCFGGTNGKNECGSAVTAQDKARWSLTR